MTPREEEYTTTTPGEGEQPLGEKSTSQLEEEISQIRADMDTTLDRIERQFSPGELLDRALHSVTGGPVEFAENLGRSVRDNPLPAALVGIGIGWLFLSESGVTRSASHKTAGVKETGGEMAQRARGRLQETSHAVSERLQHGRERLHEIREKAHERRERMGGKVSSFGSSIQENRLPVLLAGIGIGWLLMSGAASSQAVRRKSGEWQERGRDWQGAGRAKLEETSRTLSERLHGTGQKAQMKREKLSGKAQMLREKAQQARGGYRQVRDEKPMLLVALGMAAGIVAGGLLPITRREKDTLGEAGVKAREMVQEQAVKTGQMASQVAGAAAQAAREETERHLH